MSRRKKRKQPPPKDVICPKCGKVAIIVASAYGLKWTCCGLWSYQGRPLVDARMHRARVAAHNVFDTLWTTGRYTRTEAYRLLSKEMRISRDRCHISQMSLEQLNNVARAVEYIYLGSQG